MEHKVTTIIKEYYYNNREERNIHSKEMIEQGYEDSGQVRERESLYDNNFKWYGKYVKYEYEKIYEDRERHNKIIEEIEKVYPDTKFKMLYEDSGIQLIYNNEKLEFDEIFFDKACNIALKYLNNDEQNCFAILYDHFNEVFANEELIKTND